ncbi:endolytic transglycosylase MltG [candidate division KSB3 bacterium]|uniref:Endolytic murein transglycosylase n=1 Tax=candidate division KSB3 bacterium TaxID=2044937 RepID=A0A9D5JXU3_9BACT|nr:endolytic transglycosylase MltG [candidate division KSB3 bacterium]MBD3326110.1 endolytic transglycosylase MltG [candidate division KSB3 bacterium]
MKRRILLLVVIGGCLGVISYGAVCVHAFLTVPPNATATERIIVIDSGTPLRRIAEILHDASVISDKNLFMILARFYREGKSIKAGEYRLTTSMLPVDVLEILQEGKIFFRTATIPEGYTATQIAELLDELGFVDKDVFLRLAFDSALAAELGIEAESLEGYLFPNTYYIHRGMTAEELIRTMIQEFWKVMTPDLQQEGAQKGFTVHEIVTLASIIEKEVRVDQERALISAVYNNRLNIKMKLDSDPTVIYGLENFDGNLTRADLKKDTPYNTYRNRGLPPGPIANPGKGSLLAALRPADVKYLYFVARNDGTHQFSTTYKQHLRAVREYQKNR